MHLEGNYENLVHNSEVFTHPAALIPTFAVNTCFKAPFKWQVAWLLWKDLFSLFWIVLVSTASHFAVHNVEKLNEQKICTDIYGIFVYIPIISYHIVSYQ